MFIEGLRALNRELQSKVHTMVTSRSQASVLAAAIFIQISANADDIRSYVEFVVSQGLTSSDNLNDLVKNDGALRNELVRGICSKASGLYASSKCVEVYQV